MKNQLLKWRNNWYATTYEQKVDIMSFTFVAILGVVLLMATWW